MTIQYVSDLHLEFPENWNYIKQNPIVPNADILLLAGDIVPFKLLDSKNEFFDYLSANFKEVYWVPGNHEYYYDDIKDYSGSFNKPIRNNVFRVNNICIEKEEVSLIFSTLWSKISDRNPWAIADGMADFKVIKNNGMTFTTRHFNALHHEAMAFIEQALNQVDNKRKVLISHHVPTFQHYPERFKGSLLSEAFAVDLDSFILEYKPNYWVYGHHHQNTKDFFTGETKMLTNQLGYLRVGENIHYRNSAVFQF